MSFYAAVIEATFFSLLISEYVVSSCQSLWMSPVSNMGLLYFLAIFTALLLGVSGIRGGMKKENSMASKMSIFASTLFPMHTFRGKKVCGKTDARMRSHYEHFVPSAVAAKPHP